MGYIVLILYINVCIKNYFNVFIHSVNLRTKMSNQMLYYEIFEITREDAIVDVLDQEYINFMGSETLSSTCYILSDKSSIPFYSTSNEYN